MALRHHLKQRIADRSARAVFALALGAAPSVAGCAADATDTGDRGSAGVAQAQWAAQNPVGTWTFQGFAGKCLDVGGWPAKNGTPVILYTCNGTAAQVITVVPANDARTEYELRADGRCLTASALVADAPIVLSRCDDSRAQRFVVDQYDGPRFEAADAPSLIVSVGDTSGANRTPVKLEGFRSIPPMPINDTQKWTLSQIDTTPYTPVTPAPQTGTVAFVGLANKCLDIGGGPYPTVQPAMLYDCNGTLAQRFQIVPVAGTRSDVELHAAGRCLEVTSTGLIVKLPPVGVAMARAVVATNLTVIPSVGSDVSLTACGGRVTQRFGIETFDATYIFPSGHPELALGVRGASSANRSLIELQGRGSVASDQWRIVQAEGAGYAPLLPKVSIGRATVNDHRNGQNTTTTRPAVTIQDQSRTETKLSILYRRLGTGAFTELYSTSTLGDVGTSRFAILPFAKNDTYEMKVHAEGPDGIAESVPFDVDTRTPITPWNVTVSDIREDQVTLSWHAPTNPFVDDFTINWTHGGLMNVKSIGSGQQDANYQLVIDGLQSNTQYTFGVEAHNALWGTSDYTGFSPTITTTSGNSGGGGTITPPEYICGTGISSCPAGFHPGAFVSSINCGDPTYRNQTRCDANAGLSFNSCGLPNCPSGFHPVRFQYALDCDLQTNTASLDPNQSTCAPDSLDFTMCGTCPPGYSTTGLSTNPSCDGYTQSHCHKP